MSYDLIARRVPAGGDIPRAMRAPGSDASPDLAQWAAMRELADALQAAVPGCARGESRAHGVIDLDTGRLEATVGAHEALITIPYWTLGTGGDGVDRAGTLAAVLVRAGGFTVWDPQTETVVDPDRAEEQVAAGYRMMAPAALRALGAEERRSRWKFWQR